MQNKLAWSYEPGPVRGQDLALLEGLTRSLRKEKGWNDLSSWEGGIRAEGRVRHTLFCVVHTKHQKAPVRRGRIREAALRLLDERARGDLSDDLCLVTDRDLDLECEAFLASAGIGWRIEVDSRARTRVVVVGKKGIKKPRKITGALPPWNSDGPFRGVKAQKGRRGVLGWGPGHVRVKGRIDGSPGSDVIVPGGTTIIAKDKRFQNGILIKPMRVVAGVENVFDFHCLNRDADPSNSRALYELGPVIDDPKLLSLIAMLMPKQVSTAGHRDTIQDAVWELYEDGKLSSEVMEQLEAIPDSESSDD